MNNVLRLSGILLLVVMVVVAVVLVRTWSTPPLTLTATVETYAPLKLDEASVLRQFVGAVKLSTVSTADAAATMQDLDALHAYLAQQFPRVHYDLQVEQVGHDALLFTWKGTSPSAPPIILMAHQDTVPVDPDTRARWSRDPWSGDVADGVVWGCGALDDKASLVSILEAAEQLLEQGFQPKRTIYFAFGSDEERGGTQSAVATRLTPY